MFPTQFPNVDFLAQFRFIYYNRFITSKQKKQFGKGIASNHSPSLSSSEVAPNSTTQATPPWMNDQKDRFARLPTRIAQV
jgi:hypothetical protein